MIRANTQYQLYIKHFSLIIIFKVPFLLRFLTYSPWLKQKGHRILLR